MTAQPIFITGTGTEIGKTIVAAILTEALEADYWKPVQAGIVDNSSDAGKVESIISNKRSVVHPALYKLALPASPHIAARVDDVNISLDTICDAFWQLKCKSKYIIIEGVGGIMVPLNENEFVIDLIQKLKTRVILVSRNCLGSINHSLLTAALCKQRKLNVAGWVFNDEYMDYEGEIVKWSQFSKIASIPFAANITKEFVRTEAARIKPQLLAAL